MRKSCCVLMFSFFRDIRSFFGGGKPPPVGGSKAAPTAAPPAAAAAAPAAHKKSATNKSKKEKESTNVDSDDDIVDVTESKKKSSSKVKKDRSGESKVSDAKKKSNTKKAEPTAEVKSPHFSTTTGKDDKPASASSISAPPSVDAKSKSKKRIRDDDDDDDKDEITIVAPKKEAPAGVTKEVVYRPPSPKKSVKAVGATSASEFFAQSAALTSTPPAHPAVNEKLKATVAAKQQEMARKKLQDEAEALERNLREIRESEEKAAAAAAAQDSPIIIDPPTPAAPVSAVVSSPPADISADWHKVDGSDVEEVDPPSESSRPPNSPPRATPNPQTHAPKSPATRVESTRVRSPSPKRTKLEPPASPMPVTKPAATPPKSPLQNSTVFAPFTPSSEHRGSLSTNAALRAPSPKKSPKSPVVSSPPHAAASAPTPPVAVASPRKSPTPKPTAAKRAHATMDMAPTNASTAVSMDVDDGFGGVNVDASLNDSNVSFESSPAKKLKTENGASAHAAAATAIEPPSGEKKKWYPNKPVAQPQNLGSKEIPVAKPKCLLGLTFVLTGTGDSLTREDLSDLIKKYEGKVTGSVSGKTDFLVAGLEAGESKLAKARANKTKIITEDDVLQMLRDKSKGWTPPTVPPQSAAAVTPIVKEFIASGVNLPKPQMAIPLAPKGSSQELAILRSGHQTASSIQDMLWVDSHRPMSTDAIIGNPGLVKQIQEFLSTWHTKRKGQDRLPKAMLISGPPGIGHTNSRTVEWKPHQCVVCSLILILLFVFSVRQIHCRRCDRSQSRLRGDRVQCL